MVGERSKEIGRPGFKIWYVDKDKCRTGIVIIVDKDINKEVVGILRKRDKIILLKFILEKEMFNVNSIYASHVSLSE